MACLSDGRQAINNGNAGGWREDEVGGGDGWVVLSGREVEVSGRSINLFECELADSSGGGGGDGEEFQASLLTAGDALNG